MIDTITLGDLELPVTPMNPHEACEAMFVLAPYSDILLTEKEAVNKIDDLIKAMLERSPFDFIRLIALMLHISADQILEQGDKIQGPDSVNALVYGLNVNNLPDLMAMSMALGIAEVPE